MLIDTHAHVNFSAYKEDAEPTIQRALDEGVNLVLVGTQMDTSKEAVAIAEKFDGVYAAIGIHPVHTYSQDLQEEETHFKTRAEHFDTALYRSMAESPKVVGIGECGLDYFRLPAEGDHGAVKKMQAEAFIQQIKLAKELNKTLIIHSRSSKGTDDACLDILEILKRETLSLNPSPRGGGKTAEPSPSGRGQGEGLLRVVLHSYTGSPEVAKMFVELGSYVSFNGIITFDKTGNQEAVLKVVPDDKIVLETDCPYLTPVPHRGQRNEPAYVKHVAEKAAQVKNISIDEISQMTTQNAKKLFNI